MKLNNLFNNEKKIILESIRRLKKIGTPGLLTEARKIITTVEIIDDDDGKPEMVQTTNVTDEAKPEMVQTTNVTDEAKAHFVDKVKEI